MIRNKIKILLMVIIGGFLILAIIIFLVIQIVESTPMYKENKEFRDKFNLELKGEIIDIQEDGSLRIACLKVKEANYKEYKNENHKFFIRVKDSLAVMIYSTKHMNQSRPQYKIGSQLFINHNNNKKIIELNGRDTISSYMIRRFPTRNYLENSCIPD